MGSGARVALLAGGAALALSAAACGGSVRSPLIVAPRTTYNRHATAQCLIAHRVFLVNIARGDFAGWIKPLLPPGVQGDLEIVGVSLPKPRAGLISPIDNVTLYFFSNPRLARKGLKRLVRFHYYGDGVPSSRRIPWELHPPPKSAAALVALQEMAGNVAIFWQYPRHRVAYSNRLIKSCLRK